MERSWTSIIVAILLMAACVWGGCVSCTQYLGAVKSHCCQTKECGKADDAAKDCQTMPWDQATSAAPVLAVAWTSVEPVIPAEYRTSLQSSHDPYHPVPGPLPDLVVLHAALLI